MKKRACQTILILLFLSSMAFASECWYKDDYNHITYDSDELPKEVEGNEIWFQFDYHEHNNIYIDVHMFNGLLNGPKDQLAKIVIDFDRVFLFYHPTWMEIEVTSPDGFDSKRVKTRILHDFPEGKNRVVDVGECSSKFEWNMNQLFQGGKPGIGHVDLFVCGRKVRFHHKFKFDGKHILFSRVYAYNDWLEEMSIKQKAEREREDEETLRLFRERKQRMRAQGLDWFTGEPLKDKPRTVDNFKKPHQPPRDQQQASLCSLKIVNETEETWDVQINLESSGMLRAWSEAVYPLNSCNYVNVSLNSNFPNFRNYNKVFYPNERKGYQYFLRLRYK